MTTHTSADAGRAAVDRSGPKSATASSTESSARIDRLSRDALRNQQVHPLMDLVRRYREREMP